ncbi:hypothetical protein PLEOSDRAFT_1098298 [Pleurotus ostreatus PC15]|uniref:Protein kinase domain-containing protein n=1 Tax=Pleurotus ostreatus (strain PC15) TaxID=1137138 RepID=A0A067N301_PLEO1|nr:hypothetical protein PLEOSDRAFT_1098298 [Pleurotus ostreatus PC15]
MADRQASGSTGPPPEGPPAAGVPQESEIKTTPRTVRTAGGDTGISKLRDHIAEQMEGEFSIVSVEAFMSHYLPFEPTEDDVKDTEKSLAEMKLSVLVEVDGELRFHEFLVPPCNANGTETPSYRPLEDISRAIASVPVEGRTRNEFSFRVCPNTVIKSQIAGSDNRVDGCFTSEDPESKTLDTSRLACILEYKLNRLQEVENNKQALSASVQIMNDDVRRMFTYGITIIQDRVTLWYHSRSHSMISEPFSFVKNPQLLIKVFMSFLFATEEELGYDPMVTRDAKGDYIYRIPSTEQGQQCDRFFRTTASIAEYRSNNITGRMARVWKVVECNPSGAVLSPSEPSRVLKDVWLEDSALTESQIQSQIFADLKKFFRDKQDARYLAFEELHPSISELEHEDRYEKYFIKIMTDYEGKRTKPLLSNSQRMRKLFTTIKPLALPTTAHRGGSGTPRPLESKDALDETPREFAPRKQYRVVFGEVCEAVGDLRTVGEVADVLSQAVVALRLMYCAGWVHRDISSGNILAHPSDGAWQAKLSDLEYSRRFSFDLERDVGRDPKTGTPYFMPHEILRSRYLKFPTSTLPDTTFDLDTFQDTEDPAAPQMPLVYNFQHDLESIWWIFLWTITCRVSHPPSIVFGQGIFKNTMDLSSERSACFEDSITTSLRPCLLPPLERLAAPLERLRRAMVNAYMHHHKNQDWSNLSSYIHIHNAFHFFFLAIGLSRANWGGTALVTSHQPVASIAEVGSTADLNNVEQVPNISNPTRRKPSRRKRTLPRDDDDYVPNSKGEGSKKSTRAKRSRGIQ